MDFRERAAEKVIKLMLAEENAGKVSHENALFKVNDEDTREELLDLISRDEEHSELLENAVKNLRETKNKNVKKFRTFSQVVDLGEKNEKEILGGIIRVQRTILLLYLQVKDLLKNFDDEEIIQEAGIEFKVGRLRETIENILEDKPNDVIAAEEALAKYYNSHLNEKPQRWGFQKKIF